MQTSDVVLYSKLGFACVIVCLHSANGVQTGCVGLRYLDILLRIWIIGGYLRAEEKKPEKEEKNWNLGKLEDPIYTGSE